MTSTLGTPDGAGIGRKFMPAGHLARVGPGPAGALVMDEKGELDVVVEAGLGQGTGGQCLDRT
ncbi:hypothetical protein [Streptomyces sp. NPDC058247]|uniref:hypothetical protein n=1 Tax=Streptomyces sp. NPDC058247 TaxID=3346401 RepID=UPI0036E66D75